MTDDPKKVAVAVVGAGGWGKNHVRSLAAMPGADLRYVCDSSAQVRASIGALAPSARIVADLDEVLADPAVEAVVVATDAPSHHGIAERILRADKDVLVEKPLTLEVAASEALCDLADARGRILMVGHLLLFHPAVEKLRDLIDAGELGEILYITAQRLNLGVVRSDENAWWSLAPHDISVANYLLGAEPEAVSASGGVFLQRERGIEDVVFATLYYPRGRIAHVHVSWLDPHKIRRLKVVGTRKMAVFDDGSADQKLALFDKGVEPPPKAISYSDGVRVRTGDIVMPALRMSEPLGREHAAFLKAVRDRTKNAADGRAGLAVVRALAAGSQSLLKEGQRVAVEASAGVHG